MPAAGKVPNPQEKPAYVRRLFGDISNVYDRMNSIMSLGMDRGWRRRLLASVGVGSGDRVLDLCSGTGEVALEAAQLVGPKGQVTCLDFSPEMLDKAKSKAATRGLLDRMEFVVGDALNLPFASSSFDVVTVAFGVRNFADIPRGFAEMARVLKSQGFAGCLELSKPTLPLFSQLYGIYFHRLVPHVGRIIYGSDGPYDYLPASLVAFPVREQLARLMSESGFDKVEFAQLALGTVAIHLGVKA